MVVLAPIIIESQSSFTWITMGHKSLCKASIAHQSNIQFYFFPA